MATVIKASCHDCGDVELAVRRPRGAGVHPGRPGHLRLPLPELPDVRREAGRARGSSTCWSPPASPLVEWQLPAELFEPRGGDPDQPRRPHRLPPPPPGATTGSTRSLSDRMMSLLWAVPPVAFAMGAVAGAGAAPWDRRGGRRPAGRAAALQRGAGGRRRGALGDRAMPGRTARRPAPRLSPRGPPVHSGDVQHRGWRAASSSCSIALIVLGPAAPARRGPPGRQGHGRPAAALDGLPERDEAGPRRRLTTPPGSRPAATSSAASEADAGAAGRRPPTAVGAARRGPRPKRRPPTSAEAPAATEAGRGLDRARSRRAADGAAEEDPARKAAAQEGGGEEGGPERRPGARRRRTDRLR